MFIGFNTSERSYLHSVLIGSDCFIFIINVGVIVNAEYVYVVKIMHMVVFSH